MNLQTRSLAPMGTASFFFGGLVAYETAEKKDIVDSGKKLLKKLLFLFFFLFKQFHNEIPAKE